MAMTLRLSIAPLVAAGACAAACFPVTTGRITGRDLALAEPAFAALPASYTVGIAPEPGMRRTFAAAELERIATANHIPLAGIAEACFEIPTRRLAESDIAPVMRRSLPESSELKIIEISKRETPAGEINFDRNGLEPPAPSSGGEQLWRGFVRYAETRKAPVWARVMVTEHYKAVVATRDLAANTPIPAVSLRLEERTGPPPREKPATGLDQVAGSRLTRPVKAGEPIAAAIVIAPFDVRRGDPVRVEVRSGDAYLALDAVAENAARQGDMVELRNPTSGKLFRARLEQGGRALLVVAPGPQL